MPLELGIFLGAKRYGVARQRDKRALILDREPYRYQKFCSDIAGQDIQAHHNQTKEAIRCVRNWLHRSPDAANQILPSADYIYKRYRLLRRQLPYLCKKIGLMINDLQFIDYRAIVSGWLKTNPLWEELKEAEQR
jgi:hypothetical protein